MFNKNPKAEGELCYFPLLLLAIILNFTAPLVVRSVFSLLLLLPLPKKALGF